MLSPENYLITVHDPQDFDGMRRAGRLTAEALDFITPHVQAGATTGEIDAMCHAYILNHGATPAPLGFHGYPKATCISPNHVVCHGIPGDKVLRNGDIVNIDITVNLDGWHGDSSRMYCVGDVSRKARKLIDTTLEALWKGIEVVRPGAALGDIGHAIDTFARANRCTVVRDFTGHGIGRTMHEAPHVLHYGEPNTGPVLREGMFFTIEPILNAGREGVKILSDGWTAVTRDRSLSAQFEHTLAVTADGFEIFTLSPKGLHRPPYTD